KEMMIESKLIVRTLGKTDNLHENAAGFDELKNDISNNLSLLELSRIEEIELREEITKLVKEIYTPACSVSAVVEKCSEYIFNNFKYIKGITTIETTVAQILDLRSGV